MDAQLLTAWKESLWQRIAAVPGMTRAIFDESWAVELAKFRAEFRKHLESEDGLWWGEGLG